MGINFYWHFSTCFYVSYISLTSVTVVIFYETSCKAMQINDQCFEKQLFALKLEILYRCFQQGDVYIPMFLSRL